MPNRKREKKQPTAIDEEHIMKIMAVTTSDTGIIVPSDETKNPTENSSENETELSSVEPEEIIAQEERKEPKRRKTTAVLDGYESIFIKSGELNVRNGKAIYIRPEFHRTIARIVQTIGEGKVSLTDYVDNVFAHHFQFFEQAIKESFNKNNNPIL